MTLPQRWTAPSRAAEPDTEPGQRFRCACGRMARADEMYRVTGLAAFEGGGDWACEGCISMARDHHRTISGPALLRAWRAPAAVVADVEARVAQGRAQ